MCLRSHACEFAPNSRICFTFPESNMWLHLPNRASPRIHPNRPSSRMPRIVFPEESPCLTHPIPRIEGRTFPECPNQILWWHPFHAPEVFQSQSESTRMCIRHSSSVAISSVFFRSHPPRLGLRNCPLCNLPLSEKVDNYIICLIVRFQKKRTII